MKSIFKIIIVGFILNHTSILYSQNNSKVKFLFVSAETGVKVIPEIFTLMNNSSQENITITKDELNSYSINKTLLSGNYSIIISASGYKDLQKNLEISGDNMELIFNLDKEISEPLLISKRIKELHKANGQIVLGYIVDSETREAIGNVEIKSDNSDKICYSDNDGYFEFALPAVCSDNMEKIRIIFKKNGYVIQELENIENFPNDDLILKILLKRGKGFENIDEKNFRRRINEENAEKKNCPQCSPLENSSDNDNLKKGNAPILTGTVAIPMYIRVGRSCSGTSCTTVELYSLESYCKYVVPAEVYGCWGSLSGGMNSLQAFAVSVRTYGLYFIYHPIATTYDICDNTYCQVFGSSQNSYCNTAVDNTSRYIMVDNNGDIVKSEYSAENNNSGCGNGYSGSGSSWPCISDMVCSNQTSNGHGRGLCQWGSIRWATGTVVSTSSPCNLGPSHSYGIKTWQQILSHYYSVSPYNWTLTQGGTTIIQSSSSNPSTVNQCATTNIQNNINSSSNLTLMLAASIAPTGTANWISDPAHDVKLNISSGNGIYNRQFTVSCNTVPGIYDLFTALWYDKNNNNQIDDGDLVIHSKITSSAVVVSPQVTTYQISCSSSPVNGGTTSGCGIFNSGQNITVVATPNSDWTFLRWTENNVQQSTNSSYTFSVTGNRNLVAVFQQSTYQIFCSSSPVNGGTTSGSGIYNSGQSITVVAAPNSGWNFLRWTENNVQQSTNSSYTFTLTGNRNLVAHFSQLTNLILFSEIIPGDFFMYQNFPNPFNPVTKILFDIPEYSLITIEIFDITGKDIKNLVSGYLNAGKYEYSFDAISLPSGIYFCKFINENYNKIIKLTLIK